MMETMKHIIQVRIFRDDKYYVAECLDLPVVTQGVTLDELMKNVKEAIALQLEGESPADFGLAPNASLRYIPSEELAQHFYAD
jgi:predicted RNase H-like HicB family nuclease